MPLVFPRMHSAVGSVEVPSRCPVVKLWHNRNLNEIHKYGGTHKKHGRLIINATMRPEFTTAGRDIIRLAWPDVFSTDKNPDRTRGRFRSFPSF